MNQLMQEIIDQMHALERRGIKPTAVYLGEKELVMPAPHTDHCASPCEHCGGVFRHRVLGLDIYKVDAKYHVKVV